MNSRQLMLETIAEWHNPEIPVITSKAQGFPKGGFYLLNGAVEIRGPAKTNNMSSKSNVSFAIRVHYSDGTSSGTSELFLRSRTPGNAREKELEEILMHYTGSRLADCSVGVRFKPAYGLTIHYICIPTVEAVVKSGRVLQTNASPVYAGPANATQPAP